jgi:hypothetical protein
MGGSASEASLWQSYKETIVEIVLKEKSLSDRQLYEIWRTDFYMITAANPFSKLLTDDENRIRNQELHSLLIKDYQEILTGIGKDSTSTWAEEGWVVRGGEEEKLILLAKKYEQNAIFKFTQEGREIIDCR